MISDTRRRTVRLVQAAVILCLRRVAAFAQTQARVKHSAPPSKKFASLPELMKDGIHEQFTFLSLTSWHASPLTEKKLNSVAKSASPLQELAARIREFKPSYFREYPEQDRALVDTASAEMETVAHSISRASASGDEKSLEPLLTRLEAACNSCHSKFKQELSVQNVAPTQSKE